MAGTGFYWDEHCMWHGGGNYAFVMPVGGLVQPLAAGGLPESPETKRRLVNLLRVTGLFDELQTQTAAAATREDLLRVHPASYLDEFQRLSDAGGGELGLRTPFGPDGYNIAALSAGLVKGALFDVLAGRRDNAYALSRPPGHHCLPDNPMGFCLLANIAVAIEAALLDHKGLRVAVIDWDVHHGNGTEHIFYQRDDVLTISMHQENNFPPQGGLPGDRGRGAGEGCNINIPFCGGAGHDAYMYAFETIIEPAVNQFKPDVIIVACGFDGSGVDPLSRTVMGSNTFEQMTERTMALADAHCDGRLVLAHEGGYSELHVPFCGHAVMAKLSGSSIVAADPLENRMKAIQPGPDFAKFLRGQVDKVAQAIA